MKTLVLSAIIFLSLVFPANELLAQSTFELPAIELKTKDDYTKYEPTLIEATQWLETTDLDKEEDKRKKVNAFVVQYVSGTPAFSVEIGGGLMKLFEKNDQLMFLYLAGYARYALENKATPDKKKSITAGLGSMMTVYKKGIKISKNKEMEKVLKLSDSELENYIASHLIGK